MSDRVKSNTQGRKPFAERPRRSGHKDYPPCARRYSIYSPDTDVLVLAIRRYPEMCSNTSFVTGSATNRRTIKLQPIVEALGSASKAALPAFHALKGVDNTVSFSGKENRLAGKNLKRSMCRSLDP